MKGPARPESLILAGVLVPFALLLVAGFLLTADDPARPAPPVALTPAPPPALPPPPPVRPRPALDADAGAALPAATDAAVPEEEPPPGLEGAFAVLRPVLTYCFTDAAHHPTSTRLRVSFRARPDGRFDGYRLLARDWQDPYFEACVEDAFEEVAFTPLSSGSPIPVTHTFVLGAP